MHEGLLSLKHIHTTSDNDSSEPFLDIPLPCLAIQEAPSSIFFHLLIHRIGHRERQHICVDQVAAGDVRHADDGTRVRLLGLVPWEQAERLASCTLLDRHAIRIRTVVVREDDECRELVWRHIEHDELWFCARWDVCERFEYDILLRDLPRRQPLEPRIDSRRRFLVAFRLAMP